MRVLVFGAGATGSLFAAYLARAGHDVRVVARPAHVRAIQREGLRIEGEGAGIFRLTAAERATEEDRPEAVLLTVKTFDLRSAAERLASGIGRPVPVLALPNGLGVEPLVTAGLRAGGWEEPDLRFVRAIHSVPVTWVAPGAVRRAGSGEILLPRPTEPSPSDLFEELLKGMGFPVRVATDFEREVWKKALVNAAINPVTADHAVPNGALVAEPWRGQAEALLREAEEAARLEGIAIGHEEAERALWTVVRATAENRSSMLQDLDRGRPTEIDAISGEILRIGRAHGRAFPHTQRAVERIRGRVARATAQQA